MSLLTIIQDASDQIGLPRPNSVVATTNAQVRQLLRFANVEGRDLSRRYDWQALMKQATHTTLAAENQGAIATIASDGFRSMVDNSLWNQSQLEQIAGPIDAADWQALQATVTSSPYYDYRIEGGDLYLYPAPPAGDTLGFAYVSKHWCEDSGGTGQEEWAADTDAGRLDEHIMTMGIVWRFLRSKRMDYAQEYEDYEQLVNDEIRRDGTKPILNSTGPYYEYQPWIRAPSGSWNL